MEGLGLKILSLTEKDPPRYGFGGAKDGAPPSHVIWDEILKKYVTVEGRVNYALWHREDQQLNTYLEQLSQHPPQKNWSTKEELSYWINAYNAFTVKVILNHYPVASIKDIGGSIPMHTTVWDEEFFEIGNKKMSLGAIEHRILRKYYDEPRIHFAINCASVSCPILRREAFFPDQLEEQLVDQSKSFLADKRKNVLHSGQTQKLSPIFKWFSEDFGSKEDLISLVNQYSSVEISNNAEVLYMKYDWTLNDITRDE